MIKTIKIDYQTWQKGIKFNYSNLRYIQNYMYYVRHSSIKIAVRKAPGKLRKDEWVVRKLNTWVKADLMV